MRWLALTGLLLVSCGLPPHSDSVAPVPEILLDFPELSQWGHVVLIGGQEYWRPDPVHIVTEPGFRRLDLRPYAWAPYARGYLYEDPIDGLLWVSLDPWGFITEHYGFWRHHEQLGFVWRPMRPLRWSPFVATVLYDAHGSILGLCPFFDGAWKAGFYDLGFGFDDSYWAPYWSMVHVPGFYAHHRERFSGYCVSVTLYDGDRHHRTEPDRHHRRDREYRERRRHDEPRNPPESRDRQREADPQEPMIVGEGLPARPATTPPIPERGGSPEAPAGLPTISPRDLDVKPKRQEEPRIPREAFETKEIRPTETQRPARAQPTVPAQDTAPAVPARPSIEPKRPAAPARDSIALKQPRRAEPKRQPPERKQPAAQRQMPERKEPAASEQPPEAKKQEKEETREATVPKIKGTTKRGASAGRVEKSIGARKKAKKQD